MQFIQDIGHLVGPSPGGEDRLHVGIELKDRPRQVCRAEAGAVNPTANLLSAEGFQVAELVEVERKYRPEKIRRRPTYQSLQHRFVVPGTVSARDLHWATTRSVPSVDDELPSRSSRDRETPAVSAA